FTGFTTGNDNATLTREPRLFEVASHRTSKISNPLSNSMRFSRSTNDQLQHDLTRPTYSRFKLATQNPNHENWALVTQQTTDFFRRPRGDDRFILNLCAAVSAPSETVFGAAI